MKARPVRFAELLRERYPDESARFVEAAVVLGTRLAGETVRKAREGRPVSRATALRLCAWAEQQHGVRLDIAILVLGEDAD